MREREREVESSVRKSSRSKRTARIRTRSRPEIDDAVRFLPDAGNFLLRLPVRMREQEELNVWLDEGGHCSGRNRYSLLCGRCALSVRSEKAERVARTNVLKGRLLLGPKSDTIVLI